MKHLKNLIVSSLQNQDLSYNQKLAAELEAESKVQSKIPLEVENEEILKNSLVSSGNRMLLPKGILLGILPHQSRSKKIIRWGTLIFKDP